MNLFFLHSVTHWPVKQFAGSQVLKKSFLFSLCYSICIIMCLYLFVCSSDSLFVNCFALVVSFFPLLYILLFYQAVILTFPGRAVCRSAADGSGRWNDVDGRLWRLRLQNGLRQTQRSYLRSQIIIKTHEHCLIETITRTRKNHFRFKIRSKIWMSGFGVGNSQETSTDAYNPPVLTEELLQMHNKVQLPESRKPCPLFGIE